jgi:hypothetical protein
MPHRTKVLPSAWGHEASVEVRGFAVEPDNERPHEVHGRSSLTFDCGGFSLNLRPTPDELRALAALMLALAEDQEAANATAQVRA